jgi:hypothetical protein
LLRESERDVGVCRRLAGAIPDRRDPDHIQHKMVEMVTARVSAIACGHEDATTTIFGTKARRVLALWSNVIPSTVLGRN